MYNNIIIRKIPLAKKLGGQMGFISVEDPKPNVFGSDPDPEESGCQRQIK